MDRPRQTNRGMNMNKITIEKFCEIFEEGSSGTINGDCTLKGALIMAKYIDIDKDTILCGANHDIIYGPDIDELVDAGITEEDARALLDAGWMIEDEYLVAYV